jgi:hypothetical protein
VTGSGRQRDPLTKVIRAVERVMEITNWMVCGGIWLVCACSALLFMRGASIVNARAAAIDDESAGIDAQQMAPHLRRALHASRSSLPRSAH